VHEWLARQADALSEQAGVRRELLELSAEVIISRGAKGLEELVEVVRSTS
jgi:hypothetical protein